MCLKLIVTGTLAVLLVILLAYKNNRNKIEGFSTNDYLDKMELSNEMFSKFCKKLRVLDKPNEFNILLMKLKNEEVEKNNKIIKDLIKDINEVQKSIINADLGMKNIYKLDTHIQAKRQGEVIDKAIENIKNRNSIVANLV
jgi:hypothetical protein